MYIYICIVLHVEFLVEHNINTMQFNPSKAHIITATAVHVQRDPLAPAGAPETHAHMHYLCSCMQTPGTHSMVAELDQRGRALDFTARDLEEIAPSCEHVDTLCALLADCQMTSPLNQQLSAIQHAANAEDANEKFGNFDLRMVRLGFYLIAGCFDLRSTSACI